MKHYRQFLKPIFIHSAQDVNSRSHPQGHRIYEELHYQHGRIHLRTLNIALSTSFLFSVLCQDHRDLEIFLLDKDF